MGLSTKSLLFLFVSLAFFKCYCISPNCFQKKNYSNLSQVSTNFAAKKKYYVYFLKISNITTSKQTCSLQIDTKINIHVNRSRKKKQTLRKKENNKEKALS